MIKRSYDLDQTCYFPHDSTVAGDTLQEIFEESQRVLSERYFVQPKSSALRLWDPSMATDFHIDVVPGRYVEGKSGDVFIYQHSAEKGRLKTNLDTHISVVRDSGVLDAIRLMKLISAINSGSVKTFVLELLVIKLLEDKKTSSLSDQLTHVCTAFRDDSDGISVEDPANPSGNDLSEVLNSVKPQLANMGYITLNQVAAGGWESVFGPVESDKAKALAGIASSSPRPARPWYGG